MKSVTTSKKEKMTMVRRGTGTTPVPVEEDMFVVVTDADEMVMLENNVWVISE